MDYATLGIIGLCIFITIPIVLNFLIAYVKRKRRKKQQQTQENILKELKKFNNNK